MRIPPKNVLFLNEEGLFVGGVTVVVEAEGAEDWAVSPLAVGGAGVLSPSALGASLSAGCLAGRAAPVSLRFARSLA
jgi:hypothetical protein